MAGLLLVLKQKEGNKENYLTLKRVNLERLSWVYLFREKENKQNEQNVRKCLVYKRPKINIIVEHSESEEISLHLPTP